MLTIHWLAVAALAALPVPQEAASGDAGTVADPPGFLVDGMTYTFKREHPDLSKPQDYAAGRDPQLERALKEIDKILRKTKIARPDLDTERPDLSIPELPPAP